MNSSGNWARSWRRDVERETKHQTPEKSRNRNTKNQAPNTKEIPSSKLQTAARASSLELGAWSLELLWCLELGIWSFFFACLFSSNAGSPGVSGGWWRDRVGRRRDADGDYLP